MLFRSQFILPKRAGVCDRCGGQLIRRVDDTEATLQERLRWYETLTVPVVRHYESSPVFHRLDAAAPREQNLDRIQGWLPV